MILLLDVSKNMRNLIINKCDRYITKFELMQDAAIKVLDTLS